MMMSDHTAIKATTSSMDVSSFNNKNMHHHTDGNDDDSDHIYSNMSSSSIIDTISTMKSPTTTSVTSGSSLNTNQSHHHHQHHMDDNDGHSSQQDYQHHNDDDDNDDDDGKTKNFIIEQVVDPREVDVLCGRGGMSNHHAGNEWYRRLIRSNRPLYRACPKHTKLLVAKAIVQAVQEQKGRFLERDIKTGIWYQIPYKRAVDKTSQGLRERDRDDPTNDGTSSNKFDIQPYMSFPSIDDKASSGGSTNSSSIPAQNANNNQVSFTSSQALSTKKSKTSIPKSMGKLKQAQSGKTQQQQLSQINPNLSSTTNSITTNITTKKKAVPLKSALKKFQKDIQYTNDNISHHQQVVSPPSATIQQQQQPMSSMNFYNSSTTTSSNNMQNYNSSTTTSNNNMHNVIPLPTNYQSQPTSSSSTTLLRDTSMYRLLKHTQLLPQQSSNGSIMFHPTRVTNTVPSTADDITIPYPNIQQQQPTSNSPSTIGRSTYIGYNDTNDDNMYSGIPMNTNNTNLSNIGGVSSTSPPEASSATSTTHGLTRFTSQVSDWLNFFWPTNSSTPSGPIDENHNMNMNMTMNTNNNNNNNNHIQTMMMMNQNNNNNVQNNVFDQQISAVVQAAAATTGNNSNNNSNNNNHFTSYQNNNTNNNQTLSSSYNFNNINRNDFQQQQQQQQQLLQLHRQLSNEIDSVPFMNVIDNSNIIGNQNQSSLAGMNQLNFSFLPNDTLLTKTPVSYHQQQQQQQQPQRNYFPDMTQQAFGEVNNSTTSEVTRKRKESGDSMNWLSENIQNKCMRMDDIDNTFTSNETTTTQYQRMMVPLNDVMGKDDDQLEATTASATILESAPSELEQSVSLTLLKLAASPSKLLSGLTSFFGDRTTSTTTLSSSINNNNNNLLQQEQSINTQPPQQQQFDSTTTTISGGINPVVGTSFQRKSQSSLLDDFEDSPMEKKLRSFHQFT